jgi:biopolymer transport protein ExbD
MAEKRRFLDVWIVESNTVYKEVPFSVVTDWVQQGRLLEDDMTKPSGTKEWQRLGGMPEFRPYIPRPEPNRVEDQAEALEGVHIDFAYKKGHEEEDDDCDMIPLIDVSLVLLVFFMLTATSVGVSSTVNTPEAFHGSMSSDPESMVLNITVEDGAPVFALSVGGKPPTADESNLRSMKAALGALRTRLNDVPIQADLVINADKELRAKVARDMLVELRAEPFRSKIRMNYFGVSQKE